jgi:hypothetical protein
VAQILPRFYRRQQAMEAERRIAQLVREGEDVENVRNEYEHRR